MHTLRTRAAAFLLGAALLAPACTPDEEPDPAEPEVPAADVDYPDGPFVREGISGGGSKQYWSEAEVEAVLAHEDRTVVRLAVEPQGEEGDSALTNDFFDGGMIGEHSEHPAGLHVIDPLEERYYRPRVTEDTFSGSALPLYTVVGARYVLEVHVAPLSEGAERVTVGVPGTQGLYTGIPVERQEGAWDADSAPSEEPPDWGGVAPGDEIVLPVPEEEVHEEGFELHSIVETTETVRETSATEHRVDLDADVLFEFDEPELTEEAHAVLDEVVDETREKADPELPPVTIVGHTDGVGSDDYNRTLSEERAEAVRAYLEDELGDDYEYETEGLGATEPVAEEGGDDDEDARARNRRVEVSYNILQEDEESSTRGEETVETRVGSGHFAPPAPYLPEESEPLGSAEGTNGQGFDHTLEVHSLRRDGAFVAVAVTLTNDSGRSINPTTGAGFSENGKQGGRFSSFGVEDPGTGDVYRSVRIAEEEPRYVEPEGFPYRFAEDRTNETHLYFPAPPLDVDTVDLHAGVFGVFEGLPLE